MNNYTKTMYKYSLKKIKKILKKDLTNVCGCAIIKTSKERKR